MKSQEHFNTGLKHFFAKNVQYLSSILERYSGDLGWRDFLQRVSRKGTWAAFHGSMSGILLVSIYLFAVVFSPMPGIDYISLVFTSIFLQMLWLKTNNWLYYCAANTVNIPCLLLRRAYHPVDLRLFYCHLVGNTFQYYSWSSQDAIVSPCTIIVCCEDEYLPHGISCFHVFQLWSLRQCTQNKVILNKGSHIAGQIVNYNDE